MSPQSAGCRLNPTRKLSSLTSNKHVTAMQAGPDSSLSILNSQLNTRMRSCDSTLRTEITTELACFEADLRDLLHVLLLNFQCCVRWSEQQLENVEGLEKEAFGLSQQAAEAKLCADFYRDSQLSVLDDPLLRSVTLACSIVEP